MTIQQERDHFWFYESDPSNFDPAEPGQLLDTESRTVTTPRTRPPAGWHQLGREIGYLLPNLPITIAGFVLAVTGFSVSIGLVPLFLIGLPLLSFTLLLCRGLATFERARLSVLVGHPLAQTYYRPTTGRPLTRYVAAIRDPQRWKDWGYFIISFPVRIATWSICLTWIIGAAAGLTYILWEWSLPDTGRDTTLADLLGWPFWWADIALTTSLGLVFALSLPWVLRLLTTIEAGIGIAMLTNEATALKARTDELSASRTAVVRAQADTLRRVERDLHDGPQQRLVRLTMDLEAVQRRLVDEPAEAAAIVDSALAQTKEALTELRALSRGIAPPILTDRGLSAALSAAAARCPVPTTVTVDPSVTSRLPAAVENAAYFVVTESLTNVAKHSKAHQCMVNVGQSSDAVVLVRISDDGLGGAAAGKGHGLAGLIDRLAGVDGTLTIDSPPGLGTVITAYIPINAQ